MPKTARKKTARTAKSATKTRTRSAAVTPSAASYTQQRDHFFSTHPNSRMLLIVFVLAVAVYLGAMVWGQVTLYSAEVSSPGAVEVTF